MQTFEQIKQALEDAKSKYYEASRSGDTQSGQAAFLEISRLSEQLKNASSQQSAQPTQPPISSPVPTPSPATAPAPTQPAQPAMSSYQYLSEYELLQKLFSGQEVDARQLGFTARSELGTSISLEEIAKKAGIREVFNYNPATNTYTFDRIKAKNNGQLQAIVANLYRQAKEDRASAAFSGTYGPSSDQYVQFLQSGIPAEFVGGTPGSTVSAEQVARMLNIPDVYSKDASGSFSFDMAKALESERFANWFDALSQEIVSEESRRGSTLSSYNYKEIFDKVTKSVLPESSQALETQRKNFENLISSRQASERAMADRDYRIKLNELQMGAAGTRGNVGAQARRDLQRFQERRPWSVPSEPVSTAFGMGLYSQPTQQSEPPPETLDPLQWLANLTPAQRQRRQELLRRNRPMPQPNLPPAWS